MLPPDDDDPDPRRAFNAPRWSYQGAVALVLAVGIFLAETILCIGEAVKLVRGWELSSAGINLITATLSSLVGATATFLGRVAVGRGNEALTPTPTNAPTVLPPVEPPPQ
jgi:hypothetical protein